MTEPSERSFKSLITSNLFIIVAESLLWGLSSLNSHVVSAACHGVVFLPTTFIVPSVIFQGTHLLFLSLTCFCHLCTFLCFKFPQPDLGFYMFLSVPGYHVKYEGVWRREKRGQELFHLPQYALCPTGGRLPFPSHKEDMPQGLCLWVVSTWRVKFSSSFLNESAQKKYIFLIYRKTFYKSRT